MTGASHHRGESKQDYATPLEFLASVKRRFDIPFFTWDLAASASNTVASSCYTEAGDSLSRDWNIIADDMWLNPPFADIRPWAEKCAGYVGHGRIFFLVPAAVGSNWYAQHVHNRALVLLLNGRLSFDGKNPYPKDCLLAVYGMTPGYEVWRWRDA
jgi:phage N-6-adenine-methyltransferase